MEFTGTTVLKVEDGLITEEIGLDDGVTALKQLAVIPTRSARRTPDPGAKARRTGVR